jgi:hypothetical protein
MTVQGGCYGGEISYDVDVDQLEQPVQCTNAEQSYRVIISASNQCETVQCTTRFVLRAYPDDLMLSDCPADVDLEGCTSDEDITTAWDAWIAGLNAMSSSGTCANSVSYSVDPNSLTKPTQCGDSDQEYEVIVSASDLCETVQCTTAFVLRAYPNDLELSCPNNEAVAACLNQTQVDDAFEDWLAEFTFEGGCGCLR